MKRYCFVFLMLICQFAFAQKDTKCGFIVPAKLPYNTFASVYEAKGVMEKMMGMINYKEGFVIEERNGENNAYATIINNQRYVIYDNDFLERVDFYAGTKWASISILAHEMGHHYYNHVFDEIGSTPVKEIQADYFCGYMMAKQGATLEEATAAINKVSSEKASTTHPGRADRVASITKGWNEAKKTKTTTTTTGGSTNNGGTTNNGGNTNTDETTEGTETNVDATWIHLTVKSTVNYKVELSDDGANFSPVELLPNKAFVFKYEIYEYGWIRLTQKNKRVNIYKLDHSKNYEVRYMIKQKKWVVVQVV